MNLEENEELTEIIIPEDKRKMCRFCLKLTKNKNKIRRLDEDFELRSNDNFSTNESIIKLSLNFKESTLLPPGICETCDKTLDKFKNFLEKIHINQEILNKLIFENFNLGNTLEKGDLNETTQKENIEFVDIFDLDKEIEQEESREEEQDFDEIEPEEIILDVEYDENSSGIDEVTKRASYKALLEKQVPVTVIEPQDDDVNLNSDIKRCQFCTQKCSNQELSILHFVIHLIAATNGALIYCEVCGVLCENKENVMEHMANEHMNDDELHCAECEIRFSTNSEMDHHVLREHKEIYEKGIETNSGFKCLFCGNFFDDLNEMFKHSLIHISKRQTCIKCRQIFICEAAKIEHLKQKHPEYTHRCYICRKLTIGKKSLNKHLETHLNSKRYKCNLCDKKFRTRNHLGIHRSTHTSKFMCSVCGYSTCFPCDLKTHMRVHTAERPFKCTFNSCEKTYKTSSALSNHVKIHLNIKSFVCDVCDFTTNRRISLNEHKRVHTGEKPFTCNLCDKDFYRKSYLKSHLAKMHHQINFS